MGSRAAKRRQAQVLGPTTLPLLLLHFFFFLSFFLFLFLNPRPWALLFVKWGAP